MEYEFNETEIKEESKEPEKPKKSKNVKTWKLIVFISAMVVLFAIVVGLAFSGFNKLFSGSKKDASTEEKVEANIDKVDVKDYSSTSTLDVSGLVEETMPSLVSITNISVQEVQNIFGMFGYSAPQTQEVKSLGSGVIIGKNDTELLIVTNAHVINGAETLTVTFFDEKSYNAVIKGSDSDVDIAVIAIKLEGIEQSTLEAIKIASFGDSDSMKIGQQVVAIGNALGYGQSVTTGIISARDRMSDSSTAPLFQIDAAINSGNSGGALFNMNGEVIGINFMKNVDVSVEGICYAIPSVSIIPLVEDFQNKVAREKVPAENAAYIGISGQDVTSAIHQQYGIPIGVYVSSLTKDGPCEKAGIPEKSIITKFDGITINGMDKLKSTLSYYAAGEKVDLIVMVYENGTYVEKTYSITLEKASDAKAVETPTLPSESNKADDNHSIFPFNFFGW